MSDETLAEQAIRIAEACVVHPGDVLVLSTDRELDKRQADQIKAHLDRHLPDTIKTLVVGNSFQLHVLRASEQT
jgi:type IV pilus biogenesis protein CpaD/CtpE